jgi:uncharacterized protein YutE (UPF0331/DUF86 family)/predicted nucleotidyltransferase
MRRDLCVAPRTFRRADVSAKAERLVRTFEQHGVASALLFGSLARGTGEGGDLDLAVSFAGQGFEAQSSLYEAICQLFRADNIDIVALDQAPFSLRRRAFLEGQVLFERTPGHLQAMIEDVLFEQEDARYTAEMLTQQLRARLKGGLSVAERRLDRERVMAYLSQLDASVAKLTTLRDRFVSFEQFMESEDPRDLAVHHLRIALECVLDICRHFLAVRGVSLHELDTTNLIELAGTKGLFPAPFARRIRGMAGVRNAIVLAYVRLDHRVIYDTLVGRLADLDEFGRHVLGYLDREGGRTTDEVIEIDPARRRRLDSRQSWSEAAGSARRHPQGPERHYR